MQLNYIYNSPAKLKRALAAPCCTVHDGTYRFAYETYYIKPEAQLEQLHPYLEVEGVLELSNGVPLDEKALETTGSKWVYYFCRKPEPSRKTPGDDSKFNFASRVQVEH